MTGIATIPISIPPLPFRIRLVDRLTDVLVLVDDLRQELQTEDANGILWIDPYVERAFCDLGFLIQRLVD